MVSLPSALLSPEFISEQISAMHELYPEDISTSQYSFSLSPSSLLLPELEDVGREPLLSGTGAVSLNPREKDSHNAYERNCRKRLNGLYTSLRSLLPPHADETKKLSIPSTIARVIKYIPELQFRVEKLTRMKEEMFSKVSNNVNKMQFADASTTSTSLAISALCLNKKEVMIQICVMSKFSAGQRPSVSLSRIVRVLEDEGLQLMNGSSFTADDGRIFHSLQLLAKESIKMDGQVFCEHLLAIMKEESR